MEFLIEAEEPMKMRFEGFSTWQGVRNQGARHGGCIRRKRKRAGTMPPSDRQVPGSHQDDSLGERYSRRKKPEAVQEGFYRSLDRLCVSQVYGLLIHHYADLLEPGGEKIWHVLTECREKGLVRKIGVSAYEGKEIDAALQEYSLDLVQLP